MQEYCISNRKNCKNYDEDFNSCLECVNPLWHDLIQDDTSDSRYCDMNVPWVSTMSFICIVFFLLVIYIIFGVVDPIQYLHVHIEGLESDSMNSSTKK